MIGVFLIVLVLYFAGYYGLEHMRVRKGPWVVTFEPGPVGSAAGAPAMVVHQAALGISGVRLVFHDERATNLAGTVRFDGVAKEAIFGRVIYEDLTFLPGVVTLNVFGHEIELLPRVLYVNRREIPWQSGTSIDLWPTNKPAVPLAEPTGNRPDLHRSSTQGAP